MRNTRKLWPRNRGWTGGFLHCMAPRPAALALQRKRGAISDRLLTKAAYRCVEGAVFTRADDKFAGPTGTHVKLRAERKLGGRAEALTPHPMSRSAPEHFVWTGKGST